MNYATNEMEIKKNGFEMKYNFALEILFDGIRVTF